MGNARSRYILYAALLLGLAVFYAAWVWSPALGGFGGDDAVYLLSAQYFHGGANATLGQGFAASGPYPPLYPLTLALFGGASSLLAAHLMTGAFVVLSAAVFLFWLRTSEVPPLPAVLYTLAVALAPGLEMQSLDILSEPLYLLLSLTALAAASKAQHSDQDGWVVASAAATALALLTRSAGLALLLAFMIWLLRCRPRRQWWLGLAAAAPFLWWAAWHRGGGYLTQIHLHHHWLEAFGQDLGRTLRVWALAWPADVTGPLFKPPFVIVSAGVAALGLIGLIRRLPAFDALYGLLYLGLILIWPFPAEAPRLLLMVLPVLLFGVAHSFNGTGAAGPLVRLTAILALLLVTLPQTAFNLVRLNAPVPPQLAPYKHFSGWYDPNPVRAQQSLLWTAALTQVLESLPESIPRDDCILSIKPSLTALYSHRLSYAPPAGSEPDSTFWSLLRSRGCHYDLVIAASSPTFPGTFYPLKRLLPVFKDRLVVVQTAQWASAPKAPVAAILLRLPSWAPPAPVLTPAPAKS